MECGGERGLMKLLFYIARYFTSDLDLRYCVGHTVTTYS